MRGVPDRLFLFVVLAIVVAGAVLHVVGATAARSAWWGIHFYAFYPPLVRFVATLLLVAGAFVAIAMRPTPTDRPVAPAVAAPGRRRAFVLAVALPVVAALLWLARARHTYLGDGNVLGGSLAQGQGLHPREPLTMLIHEQLYRGALNLPGAEGRALETVAQNAVAAGSVAAGVLFVVVAWLAATELSRLCASDSAPPPRGVTALVWVVLVTQGYVQLFFGYVENYTYYTLAVAVYTWTALRYLRGAAPLVAPALSLVVALLLHLSGAALLPSLAVLFARGLLRKPTRRGALRDLAVVVAAVVAARVALAIVEPGYDLFRSLGDAAAALRSLGGATAPGYALSPRHVHDFVNEQLLIGPLGAWLFVPSLLLLAGARRARAALGAFLAAAAGAYLAADWMAGDSNLGYARNWDLMATSGYVFTVAGLGVFLSRVSSPRRVASALACAALVSLYHTAPWIATNASAERSLARLKVLPLGLGRTEVLVGSWYTQRGERDEARRWFERAIVVNPQNNNAYYLLGADYFEQNDMPRAVAAFTKAVELRPDKVMFRQLLVMSLFGAGRGAEAIPHLEFILAQGPGGATDWALYGEALKAAGRAGEAQAAFKTALPLVRTAWERNPGAYSTNLSMAQLLYNTGAYEEALAYFERSLEARPDSDVALGLVGYTLRRLGRAAEANDYFRRCLSINPRHADRAEMEAWLAE